MEIVSRNLSTEKHIGKFNLYRFKKSILGVYRELGETAESIQAINKLAKAYYRQLGKTAYFKKAHQALVEKSTEHGGYWRFRLLDDRNVKIALHVMPRGAKIPFHAHPDRFSITVVAQGKLRIAEDSWGRSYTEQSQDGERILTSGEISTGLPVLNNLHALKAEASQTVFFSIRINAQRQGMTARLPTIGRLAIPGLAALMMMPFASLYSSTDGHVDYAAQVLESEKAQIVQKRSLDWRSTANRLRNMPDHDSQVEAFRLYHEAATRGDAESRYWLGVMYLEGTGTTEDQSEALEWIARSSDLDYQPATEMLTYLLNADDVLEC